jgi:hypothetical protein
MKFNYVPYSTFATKTVFDVRRMSLIESGSHAGRLEVHVGPRRENVVLPGGKGLAIAGKVDKISEWSRLDGRPCLVEGFQEVFQLVSYFDCGESMCLVLQPLGFSLGVRSRLAAEGRRIKKLAGAVNKWLDITHARINWAVGSTASVRRKLALVLRGEAGNEILSPLDAWTVCEALAFLDREAEKMKEQGWRGHRGGYCDECRCNMSDYCRRWEFHRNGKRLSLYIRPVEVSQ